MNQPLPFSGEDPEKILMCIVLSTVMEKADGGVLCPLPILLVLVVPLIDQPLAKWV